MTGNIAADQSLALTSTNSFYFTGPVTNAGTITAAGSGSDIIVSSGTFTNTGTIEAEAGNTGPLTLEGTFDNQGTGDIIGDSSVILNSTLTNEGSISVAPGTTLTNEGALTNGTGTITNAGTMVSDYNNSFTEGSGPITGNPVNLIENDLDLTGSGASSFTATDAIFVTGSLASDQTLTLEPSSSVYGLTTNNGTVDSQPGSSGAALEGPLLNNGTLEVGSGSATTVAGSYTQGSGGSLQVDIGDPANYGRLDVDGNTSLAGELVTQTSGFTPTVGTSFEVINAEGNALTGTFATTAFGSQPYTTQYQAGQLDLIAASGMDVTSSSLPAGNVGTAYAAPALTTSGGIGSDSWSLNTNTLPPGLFLSSSGVISGSPTSAGTYTFTVTAADSSTPFPQTASASLQITIGGAGLAVTTTSLPAAQAGEPYAGGALLSTGGNAPVTWSVSSGKLPAGLSLDAGTGAITGTPTKAGTSSFEAIATDSSTPKAETSKSDLTIAVTPSISVTTKSLPAGQVGSAYSGATLASSGGTAPVTWAVTSGSLPAGLALNGTTGAITGDPTGPGATSAFMVTATDSSTPIAQSASATLSIATASPPLNFALIVDQRQRRVFARRSGGAHLPRGDAHGDGRDGATPVGHQCRKPARWSRSQRCQWRRHRVADRRRYRQFHRDRHRLEHADSETAKVKLSITIVNALRSRQRRCPGTGRRAIQRSDPGRHRRHAPGDVVDHFWETPSRAQSGR